MGYDLSTVMAAFAQGSPLVILVLAFVTWLGKAGVAGRAQFFTGAAIGFILGVLFLLAELGLPTGFAGYFYLILYGLVMALAPSGIYETGKVIARKAIAKEL